MSSADLIEFALQTYGYAFVFVAVLAAELWVFGRVFGDVKPPWRKAVGVVVLVLMVGTAGTTAYLVGKAPGTSYGCYDRQGAHDC